ncbi:MAG: T9SS type A sorting domain-containing protein [Bacteroidales bacterium]|nr:T9SS type A sorting domain-containing protein [Bacteroidales bacterium]MBN2761939.1 T9SS type A sorting domain-containing protein [Bacteroidales bacterium]
MIRMKRTLVLLTVITVTIGLNAQVIFEVDANRQGTPMSQDLIGVFFEDINYGADGGLYAELIQNRSFEYYTVSDYVNLQPLTAWSVVTNGGAVASIQIESTNPLNTNNPNYLKLTIDDTGTEAGIKNAGFNGIPVEEGKKYDFSVYLRSETAFEEVLLVRIEDFSGEVLGCDTIKEIKTEWTKHSLEIPCIQTERAANLKIMTTGKGILYFDMVSLFPQHTFKNRKNGLRQDLAQAIADLKPKFLRFPGGCVSHGRGLDNAYRWKATIGDVAQRKPNWNLWGYHQTYGLGFFEYFLFSEDIGAKPLPVLPVGISCQFRDREIAPISEMGPWIQDAIDLVEFANGDTTSPWGKIRAGMGHPDPFNLEYLCLGNEEDDIPEFRTRFMMIADSMKKYHPEIKIIGTSGTAASGTYYNSLWEFSREKNLYAVDEHYYMDPSWFLNNIHRYDSFDRNGPKVFIGEYASKDDLLSNAIAEAAYLTGVEKNSDVIQFTCYAPLLCKENFSQWHPDLIRFDNTRIAKTASYYVQQLYSLHAGDEYINSTITYDESFSTVTNQYNGLIGLGTWNTTADFDDVILICEDNVLIDENFNTGAVDWNVASGSFNASGGLYSQSSGQQPAVSLYKMPVDTSVYTLTLKARKTGGAEGFLIPFGYQNSQNYYWLNIAGWNNTLHAVEKCTNGSKTTMVSKSGSITNNTWYDIKIEISLSTARFYLNNELLFEIPAPTGPVTASVSKDHETDELVIKMVNSGSVPLTVSMNINGSWISQFAPVITLTGTASQRNSLASPGLIVPQESTCAVYNSFNYTLPASSFQIFRIRTDSIYQRIEETQTERQESNIIIVPNPVGDRASIIFHNPHCEDFTLYLYDFTGKQILKKSGIQDNITEISRGSLMAGTYLVALKSPGKCLLEKIIILPD